MSKIMQSSIGNFLLNFSWQDISHKALISFFFYFGQILIKLNLLIFKCSNNFSLNFRSLLFLFKINIIFKPDNFLI